MVYNHYDVIIVGLGAMGSAALYQTAKRGANVLGIDRYSPPHIYGSSHGDTRITRQAIGEGEMYMPFIRRTNEIWRELETLTNQELYITSGGLIISPKAGGFDWHVSGDFVQHTADIAKKYGIDHSILNEEQVTQRHPLVKMHPQERAYYEPDAGVLRPELCIQTQIELAQQHGATIHTDEPVSNYTATSDGVRVTTDKGTYEADKLILTAGAWMTDLLPADYREQVEIYRQVIYWFEADNIDAFTGENFPFLICIGEKDEDFFSAFPTPKDGIKGVKVLTEQYEQTTTADTIDREVKPEEIAHLYKMTQERLHGITDTLVHADVCMYTVTPDEHFILDCHPDSERVVLASPCSGHGFKHSAAVGETLAEMALDGKTTIDISDFSLSRFPIEE